jgi:hypothetical protein
MVRLELHRIVQRRRAAIALTCSQDQQLRRVFRVLLGEPLTAQRTKTDTAVTTERWETHLPAFSFIYRGQKDIRRAGTDGLALWFGREFSGFECNQLVYARTPIVSRKTLRVSGERGTVELPDGLARGAERDKCAGLSTRFSLKLDRLYNVASGRAASWPMTCSVCGRIRSRRRPGEGPVPGEESSACP